MADFEIHRHIEGGNVRFIAGCALSGFDLNPSIRITNRLSIKSDANTILVSWRPSTEIGSLMIKGVLQSVAGPLRFCHRPPPDVRGRWHGNTIAGFYHPEHAQAALKHFSGSTEIEVQVVYTVYFTAPKELSDVVLLDVEDIASQIPEAKITWEEPRGGMVTLRLSGTRQENIVDMKRILEAIYAGRIATSSLQATRYEIWHDFFATPPGEVWLQHLARDTRVVIMSDRLQRRLRIYDPEEDDIHKGYVEQKLAEKVAELDAWQESHAIQLDVKDFRKLIASETVAKAQKKLGRANVSLDILKKTLVLRCPRKAAYLVTYELNLPLPPPDIRRAKRECPQCGDATTDIEFSGCGHVACRDCFDHQLRVASSDLTGNHFPLVCWHEYCGQPVSIPDLRKYATGTVVDSLLKASLTYHIRSSPDIYRNCRTPDCQSVYLRNGSYEIFTCPNCLTQTCTLCHTEPHVGWTCAEFDAHLRKTQVNEHLLDGYKARAGTKDCPKCATLIEKVDGCNHVECSGCHGHICWVCLKVFTRSDAIYQHMNDAHGGNGLVDDGEDEDTRHVDLEHNQNSRCSVDYLLMQRY
ncbi:uncharacterized protein K460DRAFT_374509 [Cucurbitaria berberidis CBS 394.84]|uniref:RING-type domain-containing protein n=1 Tax=Cucurbitaria berberidis CBS 394.84 TaxID=1168544 RepID=A0A9P4GLW7_9PLEO|nr:uncharacterized protein K460DRAFT_374509 [Cucurbitaria berberidis CBS 394.84]KAF1847450.1 hypothetical protein K460DRAFT_374509 [Cucurbitaria berberidis CBS 394.84]